MVTATTENSTEVPLEGKIELVHDPQGTNEEYIGRIQDLKNTDASKHALQHHLQQTWQHRKCKWTDEGINK